MTRLFSSVGYLAALRKSEQHCRAESIGTTDHVATADAGFRAAKKAGCGLRGSCCSTGSTGARFSLSARKFFPRRSSHSGGPADALRCSSCGGRRSKCHRINRQRVGGVWRGGREEKSLPGDWRMPRTRRPGDGVGHELSSGGRKDANPLGLPRPDRPRLLGALPRTPARCADKQPSCSTRPRLTSVRSGHWRS